MEYGLTKSTMDRIGIKKLLEAGKVDMRFAWEVNYTNICGKKILLIVNADTRYCMVYSDIKPFVWKDIKSFINEAISDAFLRKGYTKDEIDKYFQLAGEAVLTKTHGRTAMGGMNHIVSYLPYIEKILVEGMYQPEISKVINKEICHIGFHPEFDYVEPEKFFVEEMDKLLRLKGAQ